MIQNRSVSNGVVETPCAVSASAELSSVTVTRTLLNGIAYVLKIPDGCPVCASFRVRICTSMKTLGEFNEFTWVCIRTNKSANSHAVTRFGTSTGETSGGVAMTKQRTSTRSVLHVYKLKIGLSYQQLFPWRNPRGHDVECECNRTVPCQMHLPPTTERHHRAWSCHDQAPAGS